MKPRSAASLECSKEADTKGLHGKERKKFTSECKKDAADTAAKPNSTGRFASSLPHKGGSGPCIVDPIRCLNLSHGGSSVHSLSNSAYKSALLQSRWRICPLTPRICHKAA